MNRKSANKNADPRLVWLASVLAAWVFVIYVVHSA